MTKETYTNIPVRVARPEGDSADWTLYKKSKEIMDLLPDAIKKSIYENSDGCRYDLEKAYKELRKVYGNERLEIASANTLKRAGHDPRFSRINKEWANTITSGDFQYCTLPDSVHQTVLDRFVDMIRANR